MTVAVAIEIGSGGTRAPGLDTAQGASRGPGLVTTEDQAFSGPSASGAGSFRAGWQSLLASIGAGGSGFSQTGTLKNQGESSAHQAFAETARKSSTLPLPETAGAGAPARPQSEKGIGATNARLTLSHPDAWTAFTARSIADSKKTVAGSAEEKRATASLKSASAGGLQSSHSAAPEAALAGQLFGLLAPAVVEIPRVVAVTSPVTRDTDSQAQPALGKSHADTLRDLFSSSPTGTMRASSIACSSSPDLIKDADRAANTTPQDTSKRSEGSHKEGIASTAALNTENADQAEISSDKRIPSQAAAPSLDQSPELLPTQKPVQPFTSSVSMANPLAAGSELSGMPVPAQRETRIQQGANALPVAIDRDALNAIPAAAGTSASLSSPHSAESRISGPASEKGASVSRALRSSRETGSSDSVRQGNHIISVEPSGSAANAPAALHLTGGAGEATSTTSELARRASAAPAEPDAREAFATLDADETHGRPTWIHAGAQRAEAGFQDPALGWVGVRADTSGGGIHAELVAGSADAAQTLGGHLASLNAYLAEHQTHVETLTLSSPESGWTALGSGSNSGDGMQQGTGNQQTGQETTQGLDSGVQLASPVTPEPQARFAGRETSVQTTSLDGNHISVVA